ncbi:MAG: PQQ-dependent sugar dehydrogenase [Candidatus Dadabacteria bacterium]
MRNKILLLVIGLGSALLLQAADSTLIKVPSGFQTSIVGRNIGRARHLVVNTNGDIYVKLDRPRNAKGIVRLRDKNKDGVYEDISGFGNYGGTGITIKNNFLYASSNTSVYRYPLVNNEVDTSKAQLIVKGLVDRGQHNSKSIVLDNDGNLYVNIGAPSNSCQEQDRSPGSLGQEPCPLLEIAGGIWQFRSDKEDQSYKEGVRYATGIRNVVGLDWNTATKSLFVMQHGRDQLTMFGNLYDDQKSAELPAEEMFEVKKGSNFGWPYCYFDPQQNKKVLAPEYGGDGQKQGKCADMGQPVIAFPAHMAPNGLLFYTGSQFPSRYKDGAFIAFHGSWNRAPLPQKGFFVVFVPFKDGKPSGQWEIFADGFAGKETVNSTRDAEYRPCGLAQGPDGSIYVSDDNKGMIWKISYNGK